MEEPVVDGSCFHRTVRCPYLYCTTQIKISFVIFNVFEVLQFDVLQLECTNKQIQRQVCLKGSVDSNIVIFDKIDVDFYKRGH